MSNWTTEYKLTLLSYLIKQGANINETDEHWWILDCEGSFQFHSYLNVTMHYDWHELTAFLIENGAENNLESTSKVGMNMLM